MASVPSDDTSVLLVVWSIVAVSYLFLIDSSQRIFRVIVLVCSEVAKEVSQMFVDFLMTSLPTEWEDYLCVDHGGCRQHSAFLVA